jgi:hypothetical protein
LKENNLHVNGNKSSFCAIEANFLGFVLTQQGVKPQVKKVEAPAKHQPTRSVERTDIWDANITKSFHEAYEFRFDIDTPTDIVQAHMRDQSGVIPKETFGRLSPESQKAWSQLSDDVQVDILRALQANGSKHSQEPNRMPSLRYKPRYN